MCGAGQEEERNGIEEKRGETRRGRWWRKGMEVEGKRGREMEVRE